jgi:pyrimidine operon attenuation protein/uracil phosphoribosyltransferase
MEPRLILNSQHFKITVDRLCYQLIENHDDFSNSVIIGIQPRGIFLSQRIIDRLKVFLPNSSIQSGKLDVTFYRDDFRTREKQIIPSTTDLDFLIENKKVILVDDVLYTGRTIRSGIEAILSFGRPTRVELLTLINRKFSRHLPIAANYTGKSIDTISSDKVKVQWKETDGEDQVWLHTRDKYDEQSGRL